MKSRKCWFNTTVKEERICSRIGRPARREEERKERSESVGSTQAENRIKGSTSVGSTQAEQIKYVQTKGPPRVGSTQEHKALKATCSRDAGEEEKRLKIVL